MKKRSIVKRVLSILIVVIMILGTLAACGGSSGGTKDTRGKEHRS